VIPKICFEPKLLAIDQDDDRSKYILPPPAELNDKPLPAHYYRMKAVDDVKKLGSIYFFYLVKIVLLN
jgi:hypothetical protein